jgi:hypothetical protein
VHDNSKGRKRRKKEIWEGVALCVRIIQAGHGSEGRFFLTEGMRICKKHEGRKGGCSGKRQSQDRKK